MVIIILESLSYLKIHKNQSVMPVVTYTCTVAAAVTRDYKFNLAGTSTVQSGLGGGDVREAMKDRKIERDSGSHASSCNTSLLLSNCSFVAAILPWNFTVRVSSVVYN